MVAEEGEAGVEAEVVVELDDLFFGDADPRAGAMLEKLRSYCARKQRNEQT